MKKLWPLLVLVMLCVACGGVPTEPTQSSPTTTPNPTPTPWPTPWPKQKNEQIELFTSLHQWYHADPTKCPTTGNPLDYWSPWPWGRRLDDPCKIIPGAPWLREISSVAYPLIGPYDSGDERVRRWQIQQAKAGKIDGLFVGTFYWAPYLYDRFFSNEAQHIKGTLQIAQEEGFHVAIEAWAPPLDARGGCEPVECAAWEKEVAHHLDGIKASPYRNAYITIDGRPAYWCFWPAWMSDSQLIDFLDGTSDNPRSVIWILRGWPLDGAIAINRRLKRSRVLHENFYNFPTESGWELYPEQFAYELKLLGTLSDLGIIPIGHLFFGYDERPGVPNEWAPYTMRYGLRDLPDGTNLLENFLAASTANGAKILFLESGNEYGEGSMWEPAVPVIRWRNMGQEPGLYLDAQGNVDPWKYLKQLGGFFGSPWVQPQPPPCAIVDPLMLKYYPNYQCLP